MSKDTYTLPEVWTLEEDLGGRFGSVNLPTAGARSEGELPRGKHPLQLYSLGTPNGQKVTIMLEELLAMGVSDAEYDAYLIDIMQGDQFVDGFVGLNPNSKIPALLDCSENPPIRVFESGAILLYLAEKFNKLIPQNLNDRTECLNWLFWQMASAPYIGGGFGHFFAYAPEHFKYPIDRFSMEAKRQLDVLDKHLSMYKYMTGDEYTIADIAIFPWYGALVRDEVYEGAAKFLDTASYKHLNRWANEIAQRPAVRRGRIVNKLKGEPNQQLRERHSASDFDGKDV